MPTTQPKILEILEGKSIETEIPGTNFSIWVYVARLFSKFW